MMQIELLAQSVDKNLKMYPQLTAVLFKYSVACVGCPMSGFCDLYDVMEHYDLAGTNFRGDIEDSTNKPMSIQNFN